MVYTFLLYTTLAVITVVLGSNSMKKKSSRLNLDILLLCILLALVAAFRGETGTDSATYRAIYESPALYFQRTDVEIGYKVLMYVCNGLGFSYRALFFIMNFFTCYFALDAIREEKDNINVKVALLAFALDFYLFSFNIMRQMLAISICLWSFAKWNHNKKPAALFGLTIAILFHRISAICLIVIVARFFIQNKYYKLLILCGAALGVFLIKSRTIMTSIVGLLTNQNQHYLIFLSNKLATSGGVAGFLIKIMPIVILSLLSLHRTKNKSAFRIYFGFMILGYVLSMAGEFTSSEIERIGYYFSYCRIFMLGFVTAGDIKIRKWHFIQNQITAIVKVYLIAVYIYNFYIAGACMVVPYIFG